MNLKKHFIAVDLHTAMDVVVRTDSHADKNTETEDRDVGTLQITTAKFQNAIRVDLSSTGRGSALKGINM